VESARSKVALLDDSVRLAVAYGSSGSIAELALRVGVSDATRPTTGERSRVRAFSISLMINCRDSPSFTALAPRWCERRHLLFRERRPGVDRPGSVKGRGIGEVVDPGGRSVRLDRSDPVVPGTLGRVHLASPDRFTVACLEHEVRL
jgi:hypothetical protein